MHLQGLTEKPSGLDAKNADLELLRVTPMNDDTSAYRLPVPLGWSLATHLGEQLDSVTVERPLGVFASGTGPGHWAILVSVTPLPIEVRLEEWAAVSFARKGWSVLDQRWHETPHGRRLVTWGSKKELVRATATLADSGRIYSATCLGPARLQGAVAGDLWRSALEFRLAHPAGAGFLEARRTVTFGDRVIDAPWSWEVGDPHFGVNSASLRLALRDPDGSGRAVVRVRTGGSPSASIGQRRRETLSRLRRSGWTLTDPVMMVRSPGLPPLPEWEIQRIRAQAALGEPIELRVAHGTCAGVPAELISACSANAVRSRMRATRAFEIAMESLSPAA